MDEEKHFNRNMKLIVTVCPQSRGQGRYEPALSSLPPFLFQYRGFSSLSDHNLDNLLWVYS